MSFDFMAYLQELALASRFRRAADRMSDDVAAIYAAENIEFSPRWVAYLHLFRTGHTYSVAEAAEQLGVTHPTVIKFTNQMIKAELLSNAINPDDKRKRALALTDKGHALANQLDTVWERIRHSVKELIEETGIDFMAAMEQYDAAMDRQNLYQRYMAQLRQEVSNGLTFSPYAKSYQADFERLNRQWLEQYFTVEQIDETIFKNPEKHILKKGGQIWFAALDGIIVATAAFAPRNKTTVELLKMGVDPSHQGRGIGKLILNKVIQEAVMAGYTDMMLLSNRRLLPALELYRKSGFSIEPLSKADQEKYSRADIRMSKKLT